MRKSHWRLIMLVYLLVLVMTIVMVRSSWSELPPGVAAALRTKQLSHLEFVLGIATLLALTVGYIGMFLCWGPSRHIYSVALLGKLSYSLAVPWSAQIARVVFLGNLELLLDGVLITLIWAGPAKHLFNTKRPDPALTLHGQGADGL